MFCQVLEVQNTRFKSQTGAVEGGVHCCASCDRAMWEWVKLDADGTVKKVCESTATEFQTPSDGDGIQERVQQTHKVLGL
eukprot:10352679-Ditylum_brightwellii.AAC.1